jgi:predicted permease
VKKSLPAPVCWLVRLTTPASHAGEILADLADEYHNPCEPRGRWWLARETISIAWSYLVNRPWSQARDLVPLWLRDVRLTFRDMRRGPTFVLTTSSILATGLLALVLSYGLADTLLARRVSSIHGDSLLRLGALDQRERLSHRLSFVEIESIRPHLNDVAAVITVNMQPAVVRTRGADLQTLIEVVDGRYFGVVGTQIVAGRGLMNSDDQPNALPAVVVTRSFADAHLGGVQQAIGSLLDLNGHTFAVVGTANTLGSSSFLGASVDGWIANSHADVVLNRGWRTDVENRWFSVFVQPASTPATPNTPLIDTRLAAATQALAQRFPDHWRLRKLQTSPASVVTGTQRDTATVLIGVLASLSALILFTAVANVAGVLLARAAVRRRQIAIHLSIGAGRAAVVRRQLIEGALLGIISGFITVGLYTWARHSLAELTLLPTLALRLDLPFDSRLLLAVILVGAIVGIGLALGPSAWTTRIAVMDSLNDGIRSNADRRAGQLRRLLVAAQVCLSLVLIVGATWFVRSLSMLNELDLGFPRERLVAMDFDLEPSVSSTDQLPPLARQALVQTRATPGVAFAAMSNRAPVDQSTPSATVRGSWTNAVIPDVTFYLATDGYFETVGVPLVVGRPFTSDEVESHAPIAVVNETLAQQLLTGGDVLDRSIYIGDESIPTRIVGVARDSKYRSLSEPSRPHLYRPTTPGLGLTLLVRANGEPRATLKAVQQTLNRVGPGLVGFFPRTLDDHLAIDLLPTRAAAAAATAVGALALVLSAAGLYGIVSWFVVVRRREIGIRMALGANARDVLRLVGREAVATVLPGLVLGLLVCAALATLVQGILFGVGPLDRLALLAGAVAIALVVSIASYVPARQAMRVDPTIILRAD